MASEAAEQRSRWREALREYWGRVILPYIAQRAMLMAAVFAGSELFGVRSTWHALPQVPFLDGWLRWDSYYYLLIAADGYGVHDWGTANPFFPLYPQLIVVLGTVFPMAIAALIVSNAAAMASLCMLYAWVKQLDGLPSARRTVEMVIVFPTSFFLTAAYSEPVYLAAAVGAVLAWSKRRQASAALAVVAGCLARPVGVVALGAPFMLQWLLKSRRLRDLPWFAFATAAGAGLVLLIYLSSTGDPFAFAEAPQVQALGKSSRSADAPSVFLVLWDEGWSANLMRRLLNWLALGLVGAATVHFLRRRAVDIALITLAPVAVPLCFQGTLFDAASMGRYALSGFPMFLALARWVPGGRSSRALQLGFQMIQVVLALAFFTARWAE